MRRRERILQIIEGTGGYSPVVRGEEEFGLINKYMKIIIAIKKK